MDMKVNLVGAHSVGKSTYLQSCYDPCMQGPTPFDKNGNCHVKLIANIVDKYKHHIKVNVSIMASIDPIPDYDAYMIMYDMTNDESYEYALRLAKDITEPKVFIANKIDLCQSDVDYYNDDKNKAYISTSRLGLCTYRRSGKVNEPEWNEIIQDLWEQKEIMDIEICLPYDINDIDWCIHYQEIGTTTLY